MQKVNIGNLCKLVGILLLFVSGVVVGLDQKPTLGSIAESLIVGSSMITRLMHFVSIVVGLILFIMAGSLFRAHRHNPKFVPLERPIIYIVLGIVLIFIPFLGEIFGPTGNEQDLKKQEALRRGVQIHDIDAPLEDWGNDYDH